MEIRHSSKAAEGSVWHLKKDNMSYYSTQRVVSIYEADLYIGQVAPTITKKHGSLQVTTDRHTSKRY